MADHARGAATSHRVELMLQELESLPTLSPVAVRLLELTADDEAESRDVIDLVASDPALASKVLAMCRCHERGRADNVTTVDRAVLLLGFEAVRCAVLSVQVFDLIDGLPGAKRTGESVFDRELFMLHSLACAVMSEEIVKAGTGARAIRPSEAFMAGLLHDIGQLVLHVILPESFDQVCRFAETHGASLDHACRQIIGLDTHTAGKRLAEHWGLPAPLVDVIWLNGQPTAALPRVPHRTLISVVTLADAIVRRRYVNAGAHWTGGESLSALCVPVGITMDAVDNATASLHDRVSQRATALGLAEEHDPIILLRSICRANESLARANAGMRQRERVAQQQATMLKELTRFHDTLPVGLTNLEALARIAGSIASLLDAPVVATLYQGRADNWHLVRLTTQGRVVGSVTLEPPADAIGFDVLAREVTVTADVDTLMPWLSDYLPTGTDLAPMHMLPLPAGAHATAIFLLLGTPDGDLLRGNRDGLVRCWQAALAAAAQHDRTAHLTEELAVANRTLMETQEALAHSRTLSSIGEVAAGAAHEMNNPLTVICGRSQLLAQRIQDPEQRKMAEEVSTQSHRLSDMITALRSFAEPVEPVLIEADIPELVFRVVQRYGPPDGRQPQLNTILTESLPAARLDPDLVGAALGELIRNAVESKGCEHIELRVQTDRLDDRLRLEVRDDGEGLTEHALQHAFDPFFSARPAGRQPGLGLSRARRFVEAHGGQLTLVNGPAGGAVATIWLREWRVSEPRERDAA
ncbi:MAG: HDOD domain-containing protein [Phycisphaerales bacterium]|nr:HDOD domain-containing protein [Phycisphaerae bacterium]NNF42852.1 HDOD domain-containing protein [Phycisphaerales bacterium]NNM27093.1 HDOD domain-containing protein [Phycisphaerales bacterium]